MFKPYSIAVLAAVLLTTTPSFAQKKQVDYLDRVVGESRVRLVKYSEELKKEVSKGAGFDACLAKKLKFKKTFEQWLDQNYQGLVAIQDETNRKLEAGRQKLNVLQEQTFEVVPVKSQQRTGQVTLAKVIGHFKIYNERLSTYPANKIEELRTAQEDPYMNTLGVAHSQVTGAMTTMLTTLNASLRQSDQSYSLEYQEVNKHFNLDFIIDTQIMGQARQLRFSMLENEQILISSEQLWTALIDRSQAAQIPVLNGLSADATTRFFQIYRDMFTDSCQIEGLAYLKDTDLSLKGGLSLKFEEIQAAADAAYRDRLSRLSMNQGSDSRFDFYKERGDKTCNNEGFLVYWKNERWGKGFCFAANAKSVHVNGTDYVFMVDTNKRIQFATDPSNQKKLSIYGVQQLIQAGSFDGKPVISYLTEDNQLFTVDLNGQKIRVPEPVAPTSWARLKIEETNDRDGRHCNNKDYRMFYVDDEKWSNGSCYEPGMKGIRYFNMPYVFVRTTSDSLVVFNGAGLSKPISHATDVKEIISVSIFKNRPAVTYRDSSGVEKTLNLLGEVVTP